MEESTDNKMEESTDNKMEESTTSVSVSITDDIQTNLSINFQKCVKGYHLVNSSPIKESVWEDINAVVLNESGFSITSQSSGSHKSGADLSCSLGNFSNKSSKYENSKTCFGISSYRLTKVCSEKNPGNIDEIIAQINLRKNFTHYSIMVRNETPDEFEYDWYLIPADYQKFNPINYKWTPTLGQRGKKKDSVVGWETDVIDGSQMSIVFSMSSQLWMNICITEDMKKFIIASCNVSKVPKISYIQLYSMGI
jgi:hypothetical protein